MRPINRITMNSLITFGSRIVNLGVGLLSLALIARYLGKEGFGKYAFVLAFVSFFEVLTDMGFNIILVREIARAKEHTAKLLGVALKLKLLAAVVAYAAICAFVNLFEVWIALSPEVKKALYLFGLAVTADFFVDICISAARAHERMGYEALLTTVNKVAFLGTLCGVISLDYGFTALFMALLMANLGTTLVALYICLKKFARPIFVKDHSLWMSILKEALPLQVGQIINRAYAKSHVILLQILRSTAEVGVFGAAYRVLDQLSIIPITIVNAVFPMFSSLSTSSRQALGLAVQKTFEVLLIVGLWLSAVLMISAERLVAVIFGDALLEAARPLQILGLAVVFEFHNLLFKFTLSSVNRQGSYSTNMGIAFVVNLLLALALIPTYGYMGASLAYLLSALVLFCLGLSAVSRAVGGLSWTALGWKPLISCGAMVAFMLLTQEVSLPGAIIGGTGVYAATLVLARGFSKEEVELLTGALPPRRPIILRVGEE